ncbi:MAG: right-handed parallel beta-helix repeat-containing protein [Chitinivibrionales bacterium]|nr:right-handed parallel beta-helix repeat-containing protein [Chitinivibrionales bacterium]
MEKFIIAITLLIGFSCTYADIWTVNPSGTADCNDIQAAINRAQNGDIVLMEDGLYTGDGNRNISFLGKAITVKSINGPDQCIIESSSTDWGYDRAFIFESNETSDSILDGITIRNFWFLTCCDGGAGICVMNGSPTIRNCKITNCHIQTDGCPCIILGGGVFVSQGVAFIENCIIKGNSSFYGGGLSSSETNVCTLVLHNCLIADNFAYEGAGVWGGLNDTLILSNCIVVNNYGGGIYLYSGAGKHIIQCTIAHNDYGVSSASGSASLTRSLVWENYNYQINFDPIPPYTASSNYMSDHNPPYSNPKFVDPGNNDYHLQWDSPCIDFCTDPGYDTNDVDFDGEARQMGAAVDAGADEVGPKQADFSRNGRIDLEDFAVLAAAWQTIPANLHWYVLCDLLRDDSIDLYDLEILADDWLWQASWFESE